MTHWYKLNLGDAMLANEALVSMQEKLTYIYQYHGELETMLAMYRHETSDLHCSIMVYLTAEFQAVAQLKDAIEIHQDPSLDAGFLAGNKMKMKKV